MMLNVRATMTDDFAAPFRNGGEPASVPPPSAVDHLVGQINTAATPVERAQLLAQLDTHTGSAQASDALVRDSAASGGSAPATAAPSAKSAAYERVTVDASRQPGATEGGPDQTDEPGMLFQPGESANAFAGIGKINLPDGSSVGMFSDFGSNAATATAKAAPPATEAAAPADQGTPSFNASDTTNTDTPAPAAAATEAAPASPDTAASTAPETARAADTVPTPPDTAAPPPSPPATPASPPDTRGTPTNIATTTENGSVINYPQNSPTIDNKALWYASANGDYAGPAYTPSAADGKTGVGPATGGELDNGQGGNIVYQQGAAEIHYDAQNAPYVYVPKDDNSGVYAVHIYPASPQPGQAPVNLPDNFIINSNYLANTFPAANGPFTLTNNTDGVRDYPAGYQIPGQTYIRSPLTADEQNALAADRDQADRLGLAASNPFAAGALLAGSSTSTASAVGAVADIALTGAAGVVGVGSILNQGAPTQLQENILNGAEFEQKNIDMLREAGTPFATQVSIRPFTSPNGSAADYRVRLDVITFDESGQISLTDYKASGSAGLTPRQTSGYPLLNLYGGQVVGENGGVRAPPGTILPPTEVQFVRPK